MTEKVFWADPYLTRLDAKVVSVEGDSITLDRTIFFAESGGQESDAGRIAGREVIEARWINRDILYSLAEGRELRAGDSVAIEIDWQRRYRLMRLHFAAEIVLELVYRELGRPEKIGAHIAEDKARIDFAFASNISAHFPKLERLANEIVLADHAIESAYADLVNERRYWKIPEFAAVPCGGTHLRRTSEIGTIHLKRRNIGKGKERIEITADS